MIKDILSILMYCLRISLPFLGFLIIFQCFNSLRRHIRKERPLILLVNTNTDEEIPVLYWENSIGRSKSSDIVLNDSAVSRDHAVLYRRKKGWFISDINSKYGVFINGERMEKSVRVSENRLGKILDYVLGRLQQVERSHQLYIGDIITIGDESYALRQYENTEGVTEKTKAAATSAGILFLVSLFHFLASIELCVIDGRFDILKMFPFLIVTFISWLFFFVNKVFLRRSGFELETIGVFLSGIGIITIFSTGNVLQTLTQTTSLLLGILLFCMIIVFMRDPERVMRFRLPIAAFAVLLLVINLILGSIVNGSKNWIFIGNFSIQPSEIVKVAFIFVGTATLNRLQTAKNLTGFILFTGFCIGSLFLMGDFGTACIFFVTFILMSLMRSGSIKTIVLICAIALLGAFIILKFKPYVANRFLTWGHAWDFANSSGYQQTQTLMYSASGGLFGVGIGKGYLKKVFASENDLVFGILCEEWGMLTACILCLVIVFLLIYVIKISFRSRSTLYSIASYSAAGMLVFQLCLNVFGCTDILPFTGVTFPFISLGGSSLISVWGLLAIIKASDEYTYIYVKKSKPHIDDD